MTTVGAPSNAFAAHNQAQQAQQTRNTNNDLGRDAFLRLLVIQLQNQNPLEPMSDADFIAQMATFSSLEQLTQMNTSIQMMNMFMMELLSSQMFAESTSLIGKYVHAVKVNPDTGNIEEVFEGIVSKVKLKEGIPFLVIDGREVPAAFVLWVTDRAPAPPPPPADPEPEEAGIGEGNGDSESGEGTEGAGV